MKRAKFFIYGLLLTLIAMAPGLEAYSAYPSPPEPLTDDETIVPDIYGSCVYADSWSDDNYPVGLYKLPKSGTAAGEMLILGPDASYGGVLDGETYTTTLVQEFFGIRFVTIKQYDILTGLETASFEGDSDNVSVGQAKDPVSGNIYGIFYNKEYTSLQFGTISYKDNHAVTTPISSLEGAWCAFAIDSKGDCYAIRQNMEKKGEDYVCVSSYLFRIDKSTGTPVLVGETGQKPQYPTGACFDLRTNRLYWNVCSPDGTGVMCEVDTATGKAEVLYQLADNQEYVGMYIPAPEADDKAPGALSDVEVKFNGASIEATATLTTPSTLYDGSAPEGDLTVYVLASGREMASRKAGYGEKVTMEFTVPEAGVYDITLYASNEAGAGPKTKLRNIFVGQDTPVATTATLSYENGMMNLSWLPVTTSLNGGYINLDDITYTVVRFPDNKVVKDQTRETSFSEAIAEPENIATYYYSVTVNCEGLSSAPALSNTISLGSVLPPHAFDFLSQGLEGWTVVDANNNGLVWEVEREGHVAIRYDDIPMDDWLITPGLRLEAGKAYELSFDVWARGIYYPERYEVRLGRKNTPEGMTEILQGPTETNSADPEKRTVTIIPESDGVYYVGFHAISDAESFYLYLNNVSIDSSISSDAPAAVSDLSVIPDEDGKWRTAISFTAPDKSIVGTELKSLSKIEVYRGETVIKTFNNPTPGEPLQCNDNLPKGGTYEYRVVATGEGGRGQSATVTVFVGIGLPTAPASVNIINVGSGGDVCVTWDAVTEDIDGKPISPSDVKYNIYDYSRKELELIAAGVEGTSYTFKAVGGEDQKFVQVAIYPVTDAGMLWGQLSQMIPAGKPYSSIHESFPDRETSYIWSVENDMGGTWALCDDDMLPGVTGQDGDNGFIAFEAKDSDEKASLSTGLVSLKGMEDPGFSFYVFNMHGSGFRDDNIVGVEVRRSGESQFESVYESSIVDALGEDKLGWGKITVPLTRYADDTIQVRITLLTLVFTHTAFDNISLDSMENNAVEALVSGDVRVTAAGGVIGVEGAEGHEVAIANAAGLILYSGRPADTLRIPARKGIYVVSVDHQPFKLVVR